MATVKELQRSLHSKFSDLRSLIRIIESEEFLQIFDNAVEAEQLLCVKMIDAMNKEWVLSWMRHQKIVKDQNIDFMTMKDLRALGQKLGVRNYNIVTKAALIIEIRARRKNGGTTTSQAATDTSSSREDERRSVSCRHAAQAV